jgi:pimeloyl-ACP methyl ester carboxylesterase
MADHISGPLYAEVQGGSGPVMLFLHSYPLDRRLWMFQTAHFSAKFCTIAVDLAGFGRSPAAQEGITLADHAAACWEAVDRVADGPVIIHGNSMGSEIAMWMADQRPQRTACIVLSGFGFLPDFREHQLQRKVVCRAKGVDHRRDMVLQQFPQRLHQTRLIQYYTDLICESNDANTLESLVRNAQALADADAALYPRLNVPTLMITADEDPARESGEKLHRRIRGAELVCLEGAGHACNFEVPWAYDAAVIDFLKKRGSFPQ